MWQVADGSAPAGWPTSGGCRPTRGRPPRGRRSAQDAIAVERWNRLHPDDPPRRPYVTDVLGRDRGPVVAVTDFMRAVPDQIARWVPRPFTSLGTDGFGRSDARDALRRYFEVDAAHVVVAVLAALAADGTVDRAAVAKAISRYGIDPDAVEPFAV